MTIGKGEMENITVGKGGGGCSTNSHMTVGKEGRVGWRGREKVGREEGGGGEEMGLVGLSCLGPWAEPWALKIS